MFSKLMVYDTDPRPPAPKEGDLFKVIQIHGTRFEIRYGFYEDRDRYAQNAQPIEIYPNFAKHPQYTEKGIPFATEMQTPCEYYEGIQDENSVCGDCAHYRPCEEFLGLCTYPKKLRILGGHQNE